MSKNEIAICADSIGKMYRIGKKKKKARAFSKRAEQFLTSPFEWLIGQIKGPTAEETLWAIRNITFEVHRGEILGIIGSNGAGKSTLLKVLSRITEPTEGYADINGRISSLIEVGTGMHPELTGRENIFLNGTILGMKKKEVDQKFEEIIEFADLQKFIDTPIKRYSSGMRVRLGFAIAAHLEPEILLIDEVLSVGDARFQKKCLGKMGEVVQQGRTVLFVSHNMPSVQRLCNRVIWLQEGKIKQVGDTIPIIEAYLDDSLKVENLKDVNKNILELSGDLNFKLLSIDIIQYGKSTNIVYNKDPIEILINYEVLQRTTGLRVAFELLDDLSDILIRSYHDEDAMAAPTMESGIYCSRCILPGNFLAPKRYTLRIRSSIFNSRSCLKKDDVKMELIVQNNSEMNRAYPGFPIRSKLLPKFKWSIAKLDS